MSVQSQILVNPVNFPVYVHCLDGGVHTGLVVALLRRLQLWDTKMVAAEFARYLRDGGSLGSDESRFLDVFREDVKLPTDGQLPAWLWGGRRLAKPHPTMKLVFKDKKPKVVAPAAAPTSSESIAVADTAGVGPHTVAQAHQAAPLSSGGLEAPASRRRAA